MNQKQTWAHIGISALALIAVQILQGILFIGVSMLLQKQPAGNWTTIFLWFPSIIATLSGGFFQARLLPWDRATVWFGTGIVNAIWPIIYQLVISDRPQDLIANYAVYLSAAGAVLVWYIGCKIGIISKEYRSSAQFDKNLLKGTAITCGLIIGLNVISWASIELSPGFRLAKKIDLPIPENAQLLPGEAPNPWVAAFKRFQMTVNAKDQQIYGFYENYFCHPNFKDVSKIFQKELPGEWMLKTEFIEDKELIFQHASAHWQDLSGKVLISLYLQGEKENEAGWDEGEWQVSGIILSRAYVEPPPEPTPTVQPQISPTAPQDMPK